MTISLGFHGGVGTVTGSRFLISADERLLLVDCGLFQGLKTLRERNWQPPSFDPGAVEAVVLTHAHIDHLGYLPRLVKEGFRGRVFSTPATADLAEILLMDAAKLQEEDAEYANRKGFSKHRPALPLFDADDARRALRLFREVDYDVQFEAAGMPVRFRNAGHILGSATVEVRPRDKEVETTLLFSGDLGRYNVPLHIDPDPPPACDTLMLESTYGNRTHDHTPLGEQLLEPLRKAITRGGTILIPAFAVARVQLVTLVLRELMDAGRLPDVPVHIDSPMAVDVTQIYGRYLHTGELDEGLGRGMKLFPQSVQFHRTVQQSMRLNELAGPRIIVSSSGMLTGGRVLHHLRRLGADRKNLIALVGYQAVGTRGRALLDGARTIRMHGRDFPVNAEIVTLGGFSAHADSTELVRWMEEGESPPKTIFLVHGESEASTALATELAAPGRTVTVPKAGETFELVPGSLTWESESGRRG